jgi:hypothetical protein
MTPKMPVSILSGIPGGMGDSAGNNEEPPTWEIQQGPTGLSPVLVTGWEQGLGYLITVFTT